MKGKFDRDAKLFEELKFDHKTGEPLEWVPFKDDPGYYDMINPKTGESRGWFLIDTETGVPDGWVKYDRTTGVQIENVWCDSDGSVRIRERYNTETGEITREV